VNEPHRRAGRDWFLLAPVLVPAVLLAAGSDEFGFDAPGGIDNFVYVGYFWHYPEHLWVFDDNSNYKISRLPWVLPGYVIHTLLGTIAGSYVLAYLTMAGGAVALYLLLRETLHDRTAASVVGVAWAGCTWAHGIGGWNYHMPAAAAYYLAACWLIVRSARSPSSYVVSGFSRTSVSSAMAGAFLASSVHSYIVMVTFVPLVAFLYWAALPRGIERPIARSARTALWVLGGGLVITLALAIVNRATGGAWLFFMPQIEAALKYSEPGADIWWVANVKDWLPSAHYLVIPMSFLIAGLAAVFGRRDDPDRRMKLTLAALAWAGVAIMCWFQFVRHQVAFDYSYHAFPIYLYAFPCLAAALAGRDHGGKSRPMLLVGAATLAIAGTLLFLLPAPLPRMMDAMSAAAGLDRIAPVVPPLVFALAGVSAMSLVRERLRIAIFVSWFAILNAWIAPDRPSYGVNTPGYRARMIELFREADRFTTELDPSLIGIKYWMSDESIATSAGAVSTRAVFDSFVSTRAWFTNLLGRVAPSPPVEQLTIADAERGVCIGILSSVESQGRLRQKVEARFATLGRPLQLVADRRFARGDLVFALTVLKPSRGEESAETAATAPCMRPDPK
jgi:hypothetical protein